MNRIEELERILLEEFQRENLKSKELAERARMSMVQGGSHNLRLWSPFCFIVDYAKGAIVKDVDGNEYIDYWQGHYANILGHNPDVLNEASISCHKKGCLHTGFEDEWEIKLAELILKALEHKNWKVRFTTSGTLANTYACMLALSYTKRDMILKVGGGWHGSTPFLLKGIKFYRGKGFEVIESQGVSSEFGEKIIITRFNDPEDLEDKIKKYGDKIAYFILEPFIGAGGFIPGNTEYLKLARELTEKKGIVLIFDEIISGFRFCASALHKKLNIEPELATFGKIIGGGHAVSAVSGKEEIMKLCSESAPLEKRVKFEGGTYSAHPEYMMSGYTLLSYLIENESKIYPQLGKLGKILRDGIEKAFEKENIPVKCSGGDKEGFLFSSFFMPNFFRKKIREIKSPEDVQDEEIVDLNLKEKILKNFLANRGVHVIHGGGAVSYAHDNEHIEKTISVFEEFAHLLRKYL